MCTVKVQTIIIDSMTIKTWISQKMRLSDWKYYIIISTSTMLQFTIHTGTYKTNISGLKTLIYNYALITIGTNSNRDSL